ncbi:MAG TPA: hypothetical protein VF303_01385 [Candidatus Nanoarchaeia archaeon]
MGTVYLFDYFLFTFFASFGIIQIALSKKFSVRWFFGTVLVLLAYGWFFCSKDRSVPTIVEGSQLFIIFGLSAVFAAAATRVLILLNRKK